MKSNKKVLFLTRHPLDKNVGGSNGSKAFIDVFTDLYENVSLIFPYENNGEERYYIPKSITRYPCVDKRSKIKKGIDMYLGIIHRYVGKMMNVLKKDRYDIIVLDHSITACGILRYIIKNTTSKVVAIHHNMEMEYLKDNKPSILYRFPFTYFQRKAELDCLKLAHLNLCVTEHDCLGFLKMVPKSRAQSMGHFEYKNEPQPAYTKHIVKDPIFVISGSLEFPQSYKAIISFLNDYWGLICERYSAAQLIITGRNPSLKMVDACSKWANIHLIPNPDNIMDIIDRARIYICPLNTGGGIKLRIRDALRLGMPVIAHEVSMNGYERLMEQGCMRKYSNCDELIQAVDFFMNNQLSANDVITSYQAVFGYKSGLRRVEEILSQNKLL
jgi:hypothetical protein